MPAQWGVVAASCFVFAVGSWRTNIYVCATTTTSLSDAFYRFVLDTDSTGVRFATCGSQFDTYLRLFALNEARVRNEEEEDDDDETSNE